MDNWSADKEFLLTFRAEAEERLRNMGEGLMAMENEPGNEDLIKKLFREAHTLKGSAGMMGFETIRELSHRSEDILTSVQKGQIKVEKALIDLLLETLDQVERMLPDPESGQSVETDATDLLERLVKANHGDDFSASREYSRPELVIEPAASPSEPVQMQAETISEPGDTGLVAARAEPDSSGFGPEQTGSAHEPVIPVKEEALKVVPAPAVLKCSAAGPVRETKSARDGDPTIRVNIERLDKLLNLMGEILVNQIDSESQVHDLAVLQREARELREVFGTLVGQAESLKDNADDDHIASLSQHLTQAEEQAGIIAGSLEAAASRFKENTSSRRLALDELQDRTLHVRMLPLSSIFGLYPRVVRDASNSGGKLVRFETSGEETELDKRILEQVADPLMHIIRNCIDHGIESPEDRIAAGKPEQGKLRLSAYQRGDRVEIEIEDDGAGIDVARIRDVALEKGLIGEHDELSSEDAIELLFRPGFSTSASVTDISGRGVGLDVVKNNIEKLEGFVSVESDVGAGTIFTVSLPVTLAVIKGLLVESNEIRLVIPLVSVQEMVAVPDEEIQSLGAHKGFLMRESAIPIIDLLGHLGGGHTSRSGGKTQVVVIETGNFRLGLEVGRLLGEQEVVIKPLGTFLGKLPNVAGATILGNGEAVLVLNTSELAREVKKGAHVKTQSRIQKEVRPVSESRKTVLVVEDSLVVRELQRNILEAAGYLVQTAVDGEDALEYLLKQPADCVVTDIEMPRMNGFDLTSAIRKNRDFKDTPVIMVTSCSSDDDRKRGLDVGANAYVIKGSFDQQNLLNTIGRLVA
ncbi:MAG: hybrid sensor histidine kinase/response regulator [Actinobacteria bacterium]|nr:hybrid sensor histidine kinase/response regulator [Actinomycetota bacterium]